jgi:hypothetical protein
VISASATAEEELIVEEIRNSSLPLSEIVEIKYGLKAYQEGKGDPKQTREQVENKAFTSRVRETPDFAPFFEGREIYRYENIWKEDNWLWYGPWLAEPRTPELFEGERLLFRKIVGETLVGTYIREQAYSNTLLYVLKIAIGDYKLHYTLALLNSRLLGFYFRTAYAISKEDTFPQIMLDDIAQLPIRRIEFTTPVDERARLAEEGRRLYQSCLPAPDFRGLRDLGSLKDFDVVLDFVEQQLSQEPERADAVHDLLAYLAGQMIEMNKHKQAAVEAFWLDLEGVTDAATFKRLRDKGKQEATLWKQATCRPFVSEESHATRSLDESLGWSEDAFKAFVKALAGDVEGLSKLVRVHQAHSPAYREIITRLEASDRLIDQVVYRLYRLTEEEVAVVEGRQALS